MKPVMKFLRQYVMLGLQPRFTKCQCCLVHTTGINVLSEAVWLLHNTLYCYCSQTSKATHHWSVM